VTNLPDAPEGDGAPDPFAEKLIEQLKPIVQPGKMTQVRQTVIAVSRKFHKGPLPAPEDFEHYDTVLPGAAERIIAMAEKEQAHRHDAERKVIFHEFGTRYVGQVGALVALVLLVAAVIFCAYIGQPVTASVIVAVGGIVIGFLKYSSMHNQYDDADISPKQKPKAQQSRKRK
jgi:uncharacterized membrane protein